MAISHWLLPQKTVQHVACVANQLNNTTHAQFWTPKIDKNFPS